MRGCWWRFARRRRSPRTEIKSIWDKAAVDAARPLMNFLASPRARADHVDRPGRRRSERAGGADDRRAAIHAANVGRGPGQKPAPCRSGRASPWRKPRRGDLAHASPNDKTIVIGLRSSLQQYLANRRKGKPAIAAGEAWQKVQKGTIVAALDMEAMRDTMQTHEPPPEAAAQIRRPGAAVAGQRVHRRRDHPGRQGGAFPGRSDLRQRGTGRRSGRNRSSRGDARPQFAPLHPRARADIPPPIAVLALQTAEGLLKTMKIEQSEALVVAQTSTTVPEVKTVAEGGLIGAVSQAGVRPGSKCR